VLVGTAPSALPQAEPAPCPGQICSQSVERAGAGLHGVGHLGGLLEQVGASHVPDEHEVAREHPHGFRGAGGVVDDEAQVLRRVPRRVHHRQHHVADADRVAILHQRRPRLGGEGVLPVGASFRAQEQRRAGALGQFAGAGDEIGMDVRLGDVRETQPLALGGGDVLVHVAVRVHHDRLAGGVAADEVRGLREAVVVEALEEHGADPVNGDYITI